MNNKLTQFLRKDLQEKLESGVVNSLRVQLESLNHFARQLGYKPVGGNGNFKNGFRKYDGQDGETCLCVTRTNAIYAQ